MYIYFVYEKQVFLCQWSLFTFVLIVYGKLNKNRKIVNFKSYIN